MLTEINLNNVLFLDIETVPLHPKYTELPDNMRDLWDKKAQTLQRDEETPEELYSRAGIYAEFGKIICISMGLLHKSSDDNMEFRVKSIFGDDEKKLLLEFIELLNQHYESSQKLLCAHNGKEFDFPYMARRMLINGLKLPAMLDTAGKKPWEIPHLDTMVLWKFGDYKSYTSLNLLAAIFNIPTPKSDIDGSDVARVYWEDNDLERIVEYCQRDVLTIAQLLLRFKGMPLIEDAALVSI